MRIGAGTELNDVAWGDRVGGRGDGMPGAFEQGLEQVYFIGGEHSAMIVRPAPSCRDSNCESFLVSTPVKEC